MSDQSSWMGVESSYMAQHMGTKSKSTFNNIFLSALILKRASASLSSGFELIDILDVLGECLFSLSCRLSLMLGRTGARYIAMS